MSNSDQHILVTGATGFLGSRVVEALALHSGWGKIAAAGRTLDPERYTEHDKVNYQLGDLADLEYCRKIVQGCSHVVHCASLSSPWGTCAAFYKANVVTQKNLLTACAEARIERFVYISTPSMYVNFKDRSFVREDEKLPPKLVNHYAATKQMAEQVLAKSNIPFITLRPRAIIGRGDRVIMPRLLRAYKEGRLRVIGHGQNVMDLTAVSNVVQAVLLSLEAPVACCGEVYNVTNDEPVRLWEAINYTLEELGFEGVRRRVPYRLALWIAQGAALAARMKGGNREPAIVPYSVANLARSMTLDITKIKERLGYHPQQTTYGAIDEFINWYKQKEVGHGLAI